MKLAISIITLLASTAVYAQSTPKIVCKATSEKYFINEGEEGSGPKKKDVTPIDLKKWSDDGTVLRASFEGFDLMVDLEKTPLRLFISPPYQTTIRQAFTQGGFDANGNGPNVRLQYQIPSVKNNQGNTQEATLQLECNLK